MVIILAPLVIAGYVQYKKQKAEREAQEGQQAEKNEEGLVTSDSAESNPLDSGVSCSPRPTKSDNEPPGPVAKFFRFCENLEKEIQKAQERKRQEAAAEALKQAQAAKKSINHMDSAATTTDVSDDSTESGDAITEVPSSEHEATRHDATIVKSRSLPDLHSLTLQGVVNDQAHAILKRYNSMPLTRSQFSDNPDSP